VLEGGNSKPLSFSKACSVCNVDLSQKAGGSGKCRKCYYKDWMINNAENQEKYKAEYLIKNKDKLHLQRKAWRNKNREKENAYYAEKRKDPMYRVAHNLRSRLYDHLSGRVKHKSTLELTGCNLEELKKHLESNFQPGMTWDNYGTYWSVDHNIPLCTAKTPEDLERLSHFTNLQPLTIVENCSKAGRDRQAKLKRILQESVQPIRQ
jgi:hypothetical protein